MKNYWMDYHVRVVRKYLPKGKVSFTMRDITGLQMITAAKFGSKNLKISEPFLLAMVEAMSTKKCKTLAKKVLFDTEESFYENS